MSVQQIKYQTQWTCQFYVAAELTRRLYQVVLTFGNAPMTDLLVVSPTKEHFKVDVKGQATRNFRSVQRRDENDYLFYIYVYLPKDEEERPQFFILTCAEMRAEREAYRRHIEEISGWYRDDLGAMKWKNVLRYENRWNILPW